MVQDRCQAKAWDEDGIPLEDTNCAHIGSDEDKALRKTAAASEEQWRGAGESAGLRIWRIDAFQVRPWPEQDHGNFHTGDSYIVLHTERVRDKLESHIFFWLGLETSIDEMGTAAYKTVELDDFLDGRATQSREVQGKESRQFRKLFPKITYLAGGVASGFRVDISGCALWQARLYHVRKTPQGLVHQEVTLSRESLNEGDCFVLDAENQIYVYNGPSASPFERYEANLLAERLEARRHGRGQATHTLDQRFWELLGGEGPIKPASEGSDRIAPLQFGEGVLYKLTDERRQMEMLEVGKATFTKSMLDGDAVMLLDHGSEIFLWVGTGASGTERGNAFRLAWNFLSANGRDRSTPIHLYKEQHTITNKIWNEIFAN